MSSISSLHVVVVAYGSWGHVRPLCALAARLVKLRNLDITFLIAHNNYDKVADEISKNFDDADDTLQARIRIGALHAHEHNPYDYEIIGQSFDTEYQKLSRGETMFCYHAQKGIPALAPPQALILDIMGYTLMQIARKQNSSVKILCAGPASVLSTYMLSGLSEAESGTKSPLERKIEEYMQKTGASLEDAAEGVYNIPSSKIIQAPGLPPMYHYENSPQELIQPITKVPIGRIHLLADKMLRECDGYISSSLACVEPQEVVQAFYQFFGITSRKTYLLGPLLPMTKRSEAADAKQAAKSPEITDFLQNTLQARGERSLIFISFGTLIWTTQPEKVWTFLDVLVEKKIPFIMSHASPFSQVPDEIQAKVKASGTGLIVPWAPQQAILEHPVTGWFLTHGGFNSIVESIYAGVPMICWPFSADQPLNTLHLTENLNVAYELLEVRTGDGLKPIYRTGKAPTGTLEAVRTEAGSVLEKAFGEDGDRKRANIRKLREASFELWKPGGAAWVAGGQLLDSLQWKA
ncbi:glycosyltransferase family 1 protein [Phanerochaete carnosa HHB-10118-sp]|uniref:Glycosyltransferase family 1 protein n=1 Tax=Phanerochaete carnosa (strain HHB-10118-sp) TaxID=650164 RepID=K5VYR8_PHACS|nr:glycosyltransferase family 1 protein [Phanerochaete carnosa HHB-10118-sp]EKM51754.1 glycosyltransferase family 1 protein [Phanerochaete carnosa HHB-10118-sp]